MNLQKEIAAIKQRNQRVEDDKAWETSYTRRALIAAATYVIVVVFLFHIGDKNALIDALVPTIGYLLSTISAPFVKQWWLKNCK